MDAREQTILVKAVSDERFATFRTAAGGDEELAARLYLWNRDVSMAVLSDIAILEVALRNAMHHVATDAWGSHWYSDHEVRLDERSSGQFGRAWGYLNSEIKQRPADPDVPGRLIASCTFGVWVNLLDAGGHTGKAPRRRDVDYDVLWQGAFKRAFPGGRAEARKERSELAASFSGAPTSKQAQQLKGIAFTRGWVHRVAKDVNELRNRVAHHEPLINGLPLQGQHRRMTVEEAHARCIRLARMIDRDFGDWLEARSNVVSLLASRPTKK